MTDQTAASPVQPSAALQRRLARVRLLKTALPAVAALLLVLVAGQLIWNAIAGATKPAVSAAETGVRMVAPTFTGEGRDGSHYVVTAASGQRDARDDKKILLEQPVVTIMRNGQVDTRSVSKHGVFQENTRRLQLTDDVHVTNASGYNFVAQNAVIDTGTGQVAGQAIQGAGAGGQIRSNDYAVSNKGDQVIFKGGVRSHFNGR